MEKLRMGVIGTSDHYELRVATPLKSSLLVEPYGIASRNLEKAKAYAQKWDFSRAYGSYEELLADPNIDFVYTPLPNYLHLELIKKAADAGKPVICEKPLGLNAREAVEAAEYCAKKGVPVMEAFMYRFHPQWRRAAEIVKCGEIGTVVSTNGLFSYNLKDGSNIRNIAAAGGGAILDIGCYTVSSARLLMGGEPERVVATLIRDPVFKTDILVSALLDFGGGRVSSFTIGTQAYPYQRVTALGTGGALSVKVPFNSYADTPGELTVNSGLGGRVVETEIVDQYLLEFDNFAEAIINKTEVPTPISDAIANMAVLDALFASAVSGSWEPVRKY
ncbi:oxidoreductase [Treponema primitia ZAS-2]|uniref:Oxidoreductase n=1 Tax=Treponema primitia (strain ATCC BAA-887 / DSM 12427 / ZAS-2) TaxID=545694 RepID=F5YKP5_TREPZ|nr:Gfo/Idh/MocA family oxidoreductase [Treponema primitia]AEF85437.1 oxidoreductase [Treponema primitia ZAS-2]